MKKWRKVWLYVRRRKSGKRGYSLRWYDEDGLIRTQACGTDKTTAEILRRHKEAELNDPNHVEVNQVDTQQFIEDFISLRRGKVADSTLQVIERVARLFFETVKVKQVCDTTARQAEYYRTVRLDAGRSPHTVNKEYRHLKAMFNHVVRLNLIARNPFDGLKPIPAPARPIRVLSPQEVQALLDAVKDNPEQTLMLRLLIETGARIGEVLHLEFSDIDTQRGIVHIQSKKGWKTKTNRNRIVFISPKTCKLVEEHKATTPFPCLFEMNSKWPVQKAHKIFKSIAKKAGVPECGPHDLRKTVISQLATMGINQAVAQQMAGHTSIVTTTKYYTSIASEAVRKAAEQLPWWG